MLLAGLWHPSVRIAAFPWKSPYTHSPAAPCSETSTHTPQRTQPNTWLQHCSGKSAQASTHTRTHIWQQHPAAAQARKLQSTPHIRHKRPSSKAHTVAHLAPAPVITTQHSSSVAHEATRCSGALHQSILRPIG